MATTARRPPTRTRREPPAPTTVLLVRHGQTPSTGKVLPGRARGLHLSEVGRAQAADAAQRIGRINQVAAVYTSPLERTRETAAPIGAAVGQRVRTHRGLMECDFGDWTGARLNTLRRKPEWSSVQRYPSGFRFPGGESFTDMAHRMSTTLAELVSAHRGQIVVVVSHADPIKAVLAEALGTHLDLFQRIVVSPCSISAVRFGVDGPAVLSMNTTGEDLSVLGGT